MIGVSARWIKIVQLWIVLSCTHHIDRCGISVHDTTNDKLIVFLAVASETASTAHAIVRGNFRIQSDTTEIRVGVLTASADSSSIGYNRAEVEIPLGSI